MTPANADTQSDRSVYDRNPTPGPFEQTQKAPATKPKKSLRGLPNCAGSPQPSNIMAQNHDFLAMIPHHQESGGLGYRLHVTPSVDNLVFDTNKASNLVPRRDGSRSFLPGRVGLDGDGVLVRVEGKNSDNTEFFGLAEYRLGLQDRESGKIAEPAGLIFDHQVKNLEVAEKDKDYVADHSYQYSKYGFSLIS
jgi:hypothetical protein